jgi:hypothetical protein
LVQEFGERFNADHERRECARTHHSLTLSFWWKLISSLKKDVLWKDSIVDACFPIVETDTRGYEMVMKKFSIINDVFYK